MLKYGSVCSGIESATVAWHPLGWTPSFFSEIDPTPRAVLKHHYKGVPLHGDFTTIKAGDFDPIDVLVGGTPCQSFSVAGLRGGLADDRGNLALEFLRLAARLRPKWVVWENVPGVLSTVGGRDFGSILGGLGELGYGYSWRVLDAQYVRVDGFGRAVPQRRRRVLLVGCLGDWRRAAAVLLERQSLRGDPAPSRGAREKPAGTLSARSTAGGGLGTDLDLDGGLVAHSVTSRVGNAGRPAGGNGNLVAFGGNNQSGAVEVSTAVNAHGGTHGRIDFESETFVLPVADPVTAHEAKTWTHEGANNFRARNLVVREVVGPLACNAGPNSHDAGNFESNQGVDAGHLVLSAALRGREGGNTIEIGDDVAHALRTADGTSSKGYVIAFDTTQVTHPENRSQPQPGGPCHPLSSQAHPPTIAVTETVGALMSHHTPNGHGCAGVNSQQARAGHIVPTGSMVRRLTPLECERLQGFPDHYTHVPGPTGRLLKDGPRYRCLGNAMAVNVMRWLGRRIEMVEAIP